MSRSPNYPTKSLETSFEQALNAYNNIGTTAVSSDTFCEALGYSGKNGASLSALAAVRQYGLVEGRGEDVQISELFQKIYRPLDETEKYEGLKEAASNPKVFAEVFVEYENLPPENLLASIVIRKFDFSEVGAKKFAKNITNTHRYVESFKPNNKEPNAETFSPEIYDVSHPDYILPSKSRDKIVAPVSEVAPSYESNVANSSLKFKLSKEVNAIVTFSGRIDSKMIDRLISHLNLTKDIYED